MHKQGSGCLPIHVEVAPDADQLLSTDGLQDALHGRLDAGEGDRGEAVGVQEEARRFRRGDAAPDESLRDQRMQIQVRKGVGDLDRRGIQPAGHLSSIMCQVPGVKFRAVQDAGHS